MVPYVVFSFLAMIVFTLYYDWNILQAMDVSTGFLLGIRDQIIAGSLWFLPCLYIIIISDYFVMKLFKSKIVSLAISFITFLVSQTLLPNNPATDPSWFMGFDSALFYYIYYSLGSVTFPLIKKEAATTSQWILTGGLSIFAITVTILTYFQAPYWLIGKIIMFFPILKTFQLSIAFYNLFLALVIIYCNVVIAKFFVHISFLGELGRETLAFCGTEDIAKIGLTQLLAMINLKARLINPFITIIFSLIILIISKFTLVRFLNVYFPWAVGKTNPPYKIEIKDSHTHV
jgi:hypothetical protein